MIINTQPDKTKCLSRQQDHNCPLDNKDADPDTFCEAYKQGDGYICNAIAKDDPVEDEYSEQPQPTVLPTYIREDKR